MSADKETNETLVERSQRILGVSLDSPENEDQAGNSNSTGRDDNRRKAQVSQAQRTHRRRTQRYIRELENEVLRLRSREKVALDRVRDLEKQLGVTGGDAQSNTTSDTPLEYTTPGSDQPAYSFSSTPNPTPTVSDHGTAGTPSVSIDLTLLSQSQPEYACCDTAADKPDPNLAYLNDIPNQIDRQQPNGKVSFPSNGYGTELVALDAQAAVDFVLKLEEPCFAHIRFAIENHNCRVPSRKWLDNPGGPDHALTATRALLSAYPVDTLPLHPFSMPEAQVTSLLEASSKLELENESTPVQVWQKIMTKVAGQPMERTQLNNLTAAFQMYSYCNSYGCVVNKMVVDIVLSCFFPQYIAYANSAFDELPPEVLE